MVEWVQKVTMKMELTKEVRDMVSSQGVEWGVRSSGCANVVASKCCWRGDGHGHRPNRVCAISTSSTKIICWCHFVQFKGHFIFCSKLSLMRGPGGPFRCLGFRILQLLELVYLLLMLVTCGSLSSAFALFLNKLSSKKLAHVGGWSEIQK